MKSLPTVMLVAFATVLFLLSCSKTNRIEPTSIGSNGEFIAFNKTDSIAKVYGFSRSLDNYDSLPRKSMSISEFLTLMKNTNTSEIENKYVNPGGRNVESLGFNNSNRTVINEGVVITDTFNVAATNVSDPATLSGEYPFPTVASLTYNFDDLKSRAYPSLYLITIQILTDGMGNQQATGVGGSSFDYIGLGSPVPNVQWAYNHRGGAAHGYLNKPPVGFYASCYGTEKEIITIAGFTYTKIYNVDFEIRNQIFGQYTIIGVISLTKVS